MRGKIKIADVMSAYVCRVLYHKIAKKSIPKDCVPLIFAESKVTDWPIIGRDWGDLDE
jgi:hypothetical protein